MAEGLPEIGVCKIKCFHMEWFGMLLLKQVS